MLALSRFQTPQTPLRQMMVGEVCGVRQSRCNCSQAR
jgi:hypothetical protein